MLAGIFAAALDAGGVSVSLADLPSSIAYVDVSPADAYAGFVIANNGAIRQIEGSSASAADIGFWINPTSAAGSNYELRVTATSGSPGFGTTGSWLSLGTTRTYYEVVTTTGVQACTLTVEIRRASDAVVLASKSVSLSATVS